MTDDAVLSADAVERRLRKASLSIRQVLRMPDILAVIEAENLSILERLAARINGDEVAAGRPNPHYVAYLEEGNDVGGSTRGSSSRARRSASCRSSKSTRRRRSSNPAAGRRS
jgi:hypothetical protein